LSVSATTRLPRPGEREGVDYLFVDDAEFDRMVAADQLLEWAAYAGCRYGTPRAPVLGRLESGTPVLLEIDLQGARQVRRQMPEAQLVFLAPPSWDELVRRLSGRATESPAVVEARLAAARRELTAGDEFDAIVTNDDVEAAADRLVKLLVDQHPPASL
jgi:guanylate kinase